MAAAEIKPEDRLEEVRKRRAEREKAEQAAADARDLEAHELELLLEDELKGVRSEAFEIVNNRFGVFAIRKPDSQAIRNWERASEDKKASLEWQIGILRHYVCPAEKQIPWAQLAAERPGLCWQTAEAFVDLMGIDRSRLEKKR